ncbi:uroporphyrinogen-III C-methyltransferase [Yimella sp. cx-573]|nr:uroporphyrinogen-III C-methyltransferase [Yimella sp. cx-573]
MSGLFAMDLQGKPVLVVGGGPQAAARAEQLLDAGAHVQVHAEGLCEDLRDLYTDERVAWSTSPVTSADVAQVWLVSVHDTDSVERERIRRWAGGARTWMLDDDVRAIDGSALDSAITESDLSLRSLRTPGAVGKVVLVGGGPGSDDLITVRGRRELARADVVVTDRLAPVGLLARLGSTAEIVDVGKTPYRHPVPQHEINQILVERARRGQYVVRLKGGDPFVLGRGGEEWLACREAGVEVEVVPGVSSAFAAPLAGLVPVTHRGVASGVLTISGHDEVSADLLAAWPHTIVVLMGMGRLPELTAALVRAGKDASTPVAIVHKAYSPQQQTVRGTLADITERVLERQLANPSVIVIGEVVDQLDEPQQAS